MYLLENNFFIGIDGGGTHTRALIMDGAGRGIALGQSGASNYNAVGVETAQQNIGDAVASAWRAARLESRPANGVFLGMAGVNSAADRDTIMKIAIRLRLAAPEHIGVDHDIRILLAGGLGGEPGIALIVGTGSSCYARDSRGHAVQVGGYGSLVDDMGSGYALGVQAMRAMVFAADGRGPSTTLSETVLKFLGITGIEEFSRRVYHDGVTRTEIASLAPQVIACAKAGDTVALQILHDSAAALALMVATAARKIMTDASTALVIGGGLGEADTIYRDALLREIKLQAPRIKIQSPLFSAVQGAAILAMAAAGRKFGEPEAANFMAFSAKKAQKS